MATMVDEPLATEVANLAWEFNQYMESNQCPTIDRLRSIAQAMDRLIKQAEAVA